MDDVILFGIINVHYFAAGLLGGLVHSFRLEKVTPWQVMGHIVAGGLAANFFAPTVFSGIIMFNNSAANFIPAGLLNVMTPGFIGFGFGMSGRYTCYTIEKAFNAWNPFGKTKNE